jgi:3-oxoadipate enol-lactonase
MAEASATHAGWLQRAALMVIVCVVPGCVSTPVPPGAPADTARLIDTRAGRLAVDDINRHDVPRPVLILWPGIFNDRFIYRDVTDRLAAKYRLVLIDGPGHGASDPAREDFTVAQGADAIVDIMNHLQIDQAYVGGTSWGGLTGVQFGVRHRARASGLILLNTPFDAAPPPGLGVRLSRWMARYAGPLQLFANGVANAGLTAEFQQNNVATVNEYKRRIAANNGAARDPVIAHVLLSRASALPHLPTIAVPALVLAGENDTLPSATLRAAAQSMPRATFVEVANSKHISVLERPNEVAAAIEAFVDGLEQPRK